LRSYVERRTIRRDRGLVGQAITIEGLSATTTDVLVRVESLAGAMQTERLLSLRYAATLANGLRITPAFLESRRADLNPARRFCSFSLSLPDR
jgi:hypothetical protein